MDDKQRKWIDDLSVMIGATPGTGSKNGGVQPWPAIWQEGADKGYLDLVKNHSWDPKKAKRQVMINVSGDKQAPKKYDYTPPQIKKPKQETQPTQQQLADEAFESCTEGGGSVEECKDYVEDSSGGRIVVGPAADGECADTWEPPKGSVVVFDLGGNRHELTKQQWPKFYKQVIAPALKSLQSMAVSHSGRGRDLYKNNKDKRVIAGWVHIFAGERVSTPAEIANRLDKRTRLAENDVKSYGMSGNAQKCAGALHEMENLVNQAAAGLNSYMAKLEKGAEKTITAIKITAAAATTVATFGATTSLTVAQVGAVTAVGATAQEGTKLIAMGLDGGNNVGWNDVVASINEVSIKTFSAMCAARFAGPIAKRVGPDLSAAKLKVFEDIIGNWMSTAVEEVYKAATTSKNRDEFFNKLVYAVKKANVASIPIAGGTASELVPELE